MRIQEEKICLCQAIALKKRKKSDCSPKHFIDLLGLVNLYTIPSQPTSPLFMLQTKFYYEYQVGDFAVLNHYFSQEYRNFHFGTSFNMEKRDYAGFRSFMSSQ
jgi:hypothetical protein